MTREEHLLMLTVFTKQAQMIKVLVDFLKSRQIASEDDFPAFEFATTQDEASNFAVFQRAKELYLETAKGLGIHTGLESA